MIGSADNGSDPVNHALPAWDLMAGAYAAFVTLAAERHRRETHQGQEVLVPLSDVAIASLGHMGMIAEVLTNGDRPRFGNALYGAFGRDFATLDGERVMIVAITAKQWSGLLAALELEAAVAEVESARQMTFAGNEGTRFEHRDALFPLFEKAVAARTLAEVKSRFDARGVCWSPYRTLASALEREARFSLDRPLFTVLEHPSGVRYPAPGAAATIPESVRHPASRAPRLGEHTDEVLGEVLLMSPVEIAALHDEGIVRGLAR